MRGSITKRSVDGLRAAGSPSEVFLWDVELRGFGVRVKPTGAATYVLQYKAGGRTRRMAIGSASRLTPDEARKRARALLSKVDHGEDPAGAAREALSAPTVGDLVERYISGHLQPKCKPATVREASRALRLEVVPRFGRTKARALTRADVARMHAEIGKRAPVVANRVVAYLAATYAWAARRGLIPESMGNPATKVERYREMRRDRFLSPAELARLGRALDEVEHEQVEAPGVVLALRLLALTACRKSEILSLRWDHVDLQRGLLVLADTKTGPRHVVLGAAALRLLATAFANRAEGIEWVAPSWRGRPIQNLQRSWSRIRGRAGLGSDVKIHTLRHTAASVAAMGGESLLVVGRLLGHRVPATTARYAHLADDPLRAAADRTSATIAAHLEGAEPAPVVDLDSRRRRRRR